MDKLTYHICPLELQLQELPERCFCAFSDVFMWVFFVMFMYAFSAIFQSCLFVFSVGLDPLKQLHTLDVSHNQLSSTRGIAVTAATLQELYVGHNFLPTLDELDKMGVLRKVNLDGNNVMQVSWVESR